MRLASFTSRFLEHSLWGKPTTRLEDQLLRLSRREEVACGYFESLHGERWPARARHSSHIKAGARHVGGGDKKSKNENHLRCGEGPRTIAELRPQSALFRPASPLGHSAEAPALVGGEGWEVLPPLSLPDFLRPWNCVHQKVISIFITKFWGQCVRSNGLPEMGNPLGLAVWLVFYKHTRTYFSKY